MIKTILTIQEKCDCECHRIIGYNEIGQKEPNKLPLHFIDDCKCKGTGTQTAEIYDLRDFEKCECNCHTKHTTNHLGKHYNFNKNVDFDCPDCKGTGYIIPKEYEPYEIKEVSEIRKALNEDVNISGDLYGLFCCKVDEHNLKEDDRIVVRRR